MTVAELIIYLQQFPEDTLVVMSIDEEGNGFNELRGIESNHRYNRENGEIAFSELTPSLISDGLTEEEVGDEEYGPVCIVLWP